MKIILGAQVSTASLLAITLSLLGLWGGMTGRATAQINVTVDGASTLNANGSWSTQSGWAHSSTFQTAAATTTRFPAATAISARTGNVVTSVNITNGSAGYLSAPTVTFSGGGGSGATAVATLTAGVVTAITVTNGGTGYTSNPTVTIAEPGVVNAINVASGGVGYTSVPRVVLINYTSTPTIVFSGGGGTGAAATATITQGRLSAITVTNGGSGYSTAPTVAINGGGGTGATATSTVAGGQVTGITITNPGNLTNATATAVVSATGVVTGFVLTSGGSGYSGNPTVQIDAPVPGGVAANIHFNTDITADRTVTLDGDRVLGQLILGDLSGNQAYIFNAGSLGGSLTFDNAASGGLHSIINKFQGGNDVINSAITLNDQLDARVNASRLTVTGQLSGTGTLTSQGDGILALTGNNIASDVDIWLWNRGGTGTGAQVELGATTGNAVGADIRIGNISYGTAGYAVLQLLQGRSNLDQIKDDATILFDTVNGRWGYFKLMGGNETVGRLWDMANGSVIENAEGETVTSGGVSLSSVLTVGGTNENSYLGAHVRDRASGTSGSLGITKVGTGRLTLQSGSVTYTGPTTLSQGTLHLLDATAFNSTITAAAGTILELERSSGAWTYNDRIIGDVEVLKTGAGSLDLNSGALSVGAFRVSDGTLTINNGAGTFTGSTNVIDGLLTVTGDVGLNRIVRIATGLSVDGIDATGRFGQTGSNFTVIGTRQTSGSVARIADAVIESSGPLAFAHTAVVVRGAAITSTKSSTANASGASTVVLNNITDLVVGMLMTHGNTSESGITIPGDTRITAINQLTQTVTLSKTVTVPNSRTLLFTVLNDTDGALVNAVQQFTAVIHDGGKFIAATEDGKLLTSIDGVTWALRHQQAGETPFLGLTWTGSQAVAVGADGTAATSADGISWTTRTTGVVEDLNAVAAATIEFQGNATNANATISGIPAASMTDFVPGVPVTGYVTPPGTTLAAVNIATPDVTTSTVTLSAPATMNATGVNFGAFRGNTTKDSPVVAAAATPTLVVGMTITGPGIARPQTFTGTTTNGSNSVTAVIGISSLVAGMTITGPGIPADTTITVVDASPPTLTLSKNATASGTAVTLAAEARITAVNAAAGTITLSVNASATTTGIRLSTYTGNSTAGSPDITGMSNLTGLAPGVRFFGNGIPVGTTIVSVNTGASSVTLSAPAHVTSTYATYGAGVTGNITVGSNQVTNVTGLTGLVLGTPLMPNIVPTGARVLAVGASSITLTAPLNATTTGGTATFHATKTLRHFTGNVTNASPTVTSVTNAGSLSVGMPVTGAGIPAGTRINAVNTGAATVTLSANASATATGVALTAGFNVIAVGAAGRLLISQEGGEWLAATSGTSADLFGVAWSGAEAVAVGDNGQTIRSTDAINWTALAPLVVPSSATIATVNPGASTLTLSAAASTTATGVPFGYFRGNTTSGSTNVTNVTALPGVDVDTLVSGGGIPALTRLSAIDSAVGSATLSTPATLTNAAVTVATISGNFTTGSAVVTGISDFGSLAVGMSVAGPDVTVIPVSTTITAINPGVSITLSKNAASDSTAYPFSVTVSSINIGTVRGTFAQGSATVTEVSSFDGLVVGMWVSGPDNAVIPQGTLITAMNEEAGTLALSKTAFARSSGYAFGPYRGTTTNTSTTLANLSPLVSFRSGMPASFSDLHAVTWTGSQFVAVGDFGAILTSPTGTAWTLRSSGTGHDLLAASMAGTRIVVPGEDGVILTSTNGTSWTVARAAAPASVNDVRSVDELRAVAASASTGQTVALGDGGTSSTNGSTWSSSLNETFSGSTNTLTFSGRPGGGLLLTNEVSFDSSTNIIRSLNSTNRIEDSTSIVSLGGVFEFINNGTIATFTERVGQLVLSQGNFQIAGYRAGGVDTNNGTSALTFDSVSRSIGTGVDFQGRQLVNGVNSIVNSTLGANDGRNQILFDKAPVLDDGIIGGWATVGVGASGMEWATYGPNGVVALADNQYETGVEGNNWTSTDNVKMTGGRNLTARRAINSLVIPGQTLAIAGNVLSIESGGILAAGGNGTINSTGSGYLTVGTAAGTTADLILNTAVDDSTRILTIQATINDFSVGQTGNTAVGSNLMTGIGTTAGLRPGMTVTGAGIQPGTTIVSVDSTSQITLSAAATQATTNTSRTFVGGSVALTKLGGGVLILTAGGGNDYTGKTYINHGILRITNDSQLGREPAGGFVQDHLQINGGTLQFNASVTLAPNRGLSVGKAGGRLEVGLANADVRTVTINTPINAVGTLELAVRGNPQPTGSTFSTLNLGLAGQTSNFAGGLKTEGTFEGIINVPGNNTIGGMLMEAARVNLSGNNNFTDVIRILGGELTVSGSNTWNGGTNFDETISVSSGQLKLTSASALGTGGLRLNLGSNGELRLAGVSQTIRRITSNNQAIISNSDSANSTSLIFDLDLNQTYSGRIINGGNFAMSLVKRGPASLTLNNVENSFSGGVRIEEGTLNVSSIAYSFENSALGRVTTPVPSRLVIAGGILAFTPTGLQITDRSFTIGSGPNAAAIVANGTSQTARLVLGVVDRFSGFVTAPLAFEGNGARTLTLSGTNTGDNEFNIQIGDKSAAEPTSLIKMGAGTWTLPKAANYSGLTTVREGVLGILANNALGTTATNTTVSAAAATFTGNLPNGIKVSFPAFFGTTLPGGILTDTTYFVVGSNGTTFQVATTPGGTAQSLSSAGTNVQYVPVIKPIASTTADPATDRFTGSLPDGTALTLNTRTFFNDTLATPAMGNGTLPTATGLNTVDTYYVVGSDGASFQLSLTPGGAPLDITLPGTNFFYSTTTAQGNTSRGVNLLSGRMDLRNVNYQTPETLLLEGGTLNVPIGSQSSWAGNVQVNVNSNITIGIGGTLTIGGSILGNRGITQLGEGTLVLQGEMLAPSTIADHNRRFYTLQAGTLVLDYSTSNFSHLVDNVGFTIGGSRRGGVLRLVGGSHEEIINNLSLQAGANQIFRDSGSSLIRLNNVSRATGSTLYFDQANIAKVDNQNYPPTGSGILGAWAIIRDAVNGNELDWAKNNATPGSWGDGLVVPAGASSYSNNEWLQNLNTNVTANRSLGSGSMTYTLRFANPAASTITLLGGTNTLQSGGILISPTVGANDSTITGSGRLITQNQGNLQNFIFHQYNTLGELIISAPLAERSIQSRTGRLTGSTNSNRLITGLVNNAGGNPSGLTVGMTVSGVGITAGALIESIIDANTITISIAHTANGSRPQLSVGGSALVGTLVDGDRRRINAIRSPFTGIVSTTDLYVGMPVSGDGIPAGTTISGIFNDFDIQISVDHFFNGTVSTLSITPSTGIEKVGEGTLVLNGANTYTNVTFIGDGTLRAQTLNDGGVAGSFGTSNASQANLAFSGGTLQYVGENTSTNRGLTLSDFADINIGHERTVALISGGVAGTDRLEKSGPGTLVMTGNTGLTDFRFEEGALRFQFVDTNPAPATFTASSFANGNVATVRLAGGVLEVRGTPEGNVGQTFGGQLFVEEGASEVRAVSVSGYDPNNLVAGQIFRNTSISLMGVEELTELTRSPGGTVKFVEAPEVGGGAASIILNLSNFERGFVLPWAVYRNAADASQPEVNHFAAVFPTSAAVSSGDALFLHDYGSFFMNPNNWGNSSASNNLDVSEGGSFQVQITNGGSMLQGTTELFVIAEQASSFNKLLPGMSVTGPGIPAGTEIASIVVDEFKLILTAASTLNTTNQTYDFSSLRTISGTLATSISVNTLRYTSPVDSTISVPSGMTLRLLSGAILAAYDVRGGMKQITGAGNLSGGERATEGRDIILHNYNVQTPFGIGVNIVDDKLTLNGSGSTVAGDRVIFVPGAPPFNFFNNLSVGMRVTGPGIPIGTVVAGVLVNAQQIILSNPATLTQSNQTFVFTDVTNFVQTGIGTTTLSGTNAFTGTTFVHGGVLRLDSINAIPGGIAATGGISHITIEGGVLGLATGNFGRALGTGASQVEFKGASGFAAYGADRTVNFGALATPERLRFGNNGFVPDGSSLVLGSHDATHKVTFLNPIDLSSFSQAVRVENGPAAIEAELGGALSGLGRLIKFGQGTLRLGVSSTHTGGIEIAEGRLIAGNVANAFGTGTGAIRMGTSRTNTIASAGLDLQIEGGDVSKKLEVGTTNSRGADWLQGGQTDSTQAAADIGQESSTLIVNGSPAIAYYDATNGDLKFVRATDTRGSTWTLPVTVYSRGDVGRHPSLQMINGNPAISFYDVTNKSLMFVRATDNKGVFWGAPVIADALSVNATAVQGDGKVIFGGSFTIQDGTGVKNTRLARLNADGTLDTAFVTDIRNGEVRAIVVQGDGKIVIAGSFTSISDSFTAQTPVVRNRIARLNSDGTLDTAYNPNLDGDVRLLVVQDNSLILVGGAFSTVGGTGRGRIARLNSNGTLDTSFNADVRNGEVRAIAIERDGNPATSEALTIGGSFTSVAGSDNRNRIARVSSTGALDAAFNPNANGDVRGIALQADGRVVVGGNFSTIGGITRNRLARLNADGTLDASFALEVNNEVRALHEQADGKVVILGVFTTIGTNSLNGMARLNTDGTVDTAYNPDPNFEVRSVVEQTDGKLVAGGIFTNLGNATQQWVGRLNTDGTADTTLDRDDGDLGRFNSLVAVNGNPAISYYDATGKDLRFVRSTDANGGGWGLPLILDSTDDVGAGTSMAMANIGGDIFTVDTRSTLDTADDTVRVTATANIGTPSIAYHDTTTGDLKYVVSYNANGSDWAQPVVVRTGVNAGRHLNLLVVDDIPAIAYYDNATDDLKYIRASNPAGLTHSLRDPGTGLLLLNPSDNQTITVLESTLVFASAWGAPVTLDSSGDVGQFPSLAIVNGQPLTTKGTPAVSYYDATGANLKYVRSEDSTGLTWGVPLTLQSTGDVGRASTLLMADGVPAISYYDATDGDLEFISLSDASGYTRLAFDGNSTWSGGINLDGTLLIAPAAGQTAAVTGLLTGASGFKLVSDGVLALSNMLNNFGTALPGPGTAVNGGALVRSGTLLVSSSAALGTTTVELGDAIPQVIYVHRSTTFGSLAGLAGRFDPDHNGIFDNAGGPGAFVEIGTTIDGNTYTTADGDTNPVATTVNVAASTFSGNVVNATEVRFTASTQPGGIVAGSRYFVVNSTGTTFQVSIKPGGTPVVLTSAGLLVNFVRAGKLILVKDEPGHPERNGIYQIIFSGLSQPLGTMNLVRVASLDEVSELRYGTQARVLSGTLAGRAFFLASHVTDANVSPVHWVEDVADANVSLLTSISGLNISNAIDLNANSSTGTTTLGTLTTVTNGNTTFSGGITLQNQLAGSRETKTLTLTSSSNDGLGMTLSGLVSEADGGAAATKDALSLIKTGTGIITLTGNNTFGGGITVNQGTLLVMNTPVLPADSATGTGTVAVNAGTILGGIGIVGGDLVLTGTAGNTAVLRPGDPTTVAAVEELTIKGLLTVGAHSVVEYTLGADSYGRLVADGGLNVDTTARFQITLASGFTPTIGTSFDILDKTTSTGLTLANLLLPVSIVWDTTQFVSNGIIIANGETQPVDIIVDPASQTVLQGANVTFTVTVSANSSAPFTYQWRKGGVDILGATNETLVLNSVNQASEGVYSVVVSNVLNSDTSAGATLTVNHPAQIVTHPFSITVGDGDPAQFNVTVSGEDPITYQWQKDTVDVPGATSATYQIPAVSAANAGSYRVVVTNPFATATSNPATLTIGVGVPSFTDIPESQIVLLGANVVLEVAAVGTAPRTLQWKRNNANIVGATGSILTLNNITAAQAGSYTCEVKNAFGKATCPPANITVVNNPGTLIPAEIGKTATMTVTVTAPTGVIPAYNWLKNNGPLPANTRFTGGNTKTLTVKLLELGDADIYTCQVTVPGGMVIGGAHTLRIFDKAPIVTSAALPQGIIGGTYNYQIEVDPDHTRTPVSYAATGLPTGLRIDTKTGVISGKPTVTKVGGYAVKLTATNTRGKSEVTLNLNVLTLPTSIPGVYVGPVVRHLDADLGAGLGGRFDLTVTTTASYTGSITLGAVRHTFPAGTLDIDVNGALSPSATIVIRRTGTPTPAPLTVSFKIDKITGLITDATVTDGTDTAAFSGWKNVWNATTVQATKYLGLYTFAMALADGDPLIGSSAVPQGYSYASFTVARDGKLSLVGRTADGEGITGALVLGPNGEMLIFQTLYTTTPKGSIHGTLAINDQGTATDTDNTLGGNVTWVRPPNTTAAARTYKAGFGTSTATSGVTTPVTIAAVGGRYLPPVAPTVVLGIPGPGVNNAKLEFAEDGDTGDADDATDVGTNDNPDVILSVGALSKITLPTGAANPALTKLTVTPTTGIFTGTFSLDDPNPRTTPPVTPAAVKRAVTYQGLIVRDGADYIGYGYFLNAQLPGNGPPATTPTTTEMRSGMAVFDQNP